jgi:hypothetical protein
MTDLAVIVPSRQRPASVHRLCQAWADTADGTVQADLIVCLDHDDDTIHDYPESGDYGFLSYSLADRNGFAPRLTAEALKEAPAYFALASWGDDHIPRTEGWDSALVEALRDIGTGFAYGDDLIQGENLPTACAMTSDIVQALGWMTPPGMAHLYVDDVWLTLGRELGRIRYLPDVVIEHYHPMHRPDVEPDALVIDANSAAAYTADRAVFDQWKADDLPECLDSLRALL